MSKYISLENLTRYDSKIQEHLASFCASKQGGMWRQTEKAGVVQFWPVGNSPLEGTVEFKFSETGPASGSKGPTNPSKIEGVSAVKLMLCGKNLAYPRSGLVSESSYGVAYTFNPDGTITVNGKASAPSYFYVRWSSNYSGILLKNGVTYTLSGCPSGGSGGTYYLFSTLWPANVTYGDYGDGATFTLNVASSKQTTNICCTVRTGFTASNLVFKPQLELGSAVTEFETPVYNEYTINLNNTYYRGSIDFATGIMTVTWGAVVLKGTETWTLVSDSTNEITHFVGSAGLPSGTMNNNTADRACSHFHPNFNFVANTYYTWGTNTRIGFKLPAASFPNIAALNSWLASEYSAGHPVTVAYKLNNPQTVQLSPLALRSLVQPNKYVPRLNTVYTDAENVQIVYQKNPVRDKFEKVSAIVAQGGNV